MDFAAFGKNLKRARYRKDLTQAEVAQKAGVNVNYYARLERGEANPTLELLSKITRILDVKSGELLPF